MDNPDPLKHFTIPIFIPHCGCPFQCVFCNQEKITNCSHVPALEEMKNVIDQYLLSFPRGEKHVEIGFFGGNFTGLAMDEQEQYLKVVRPCLESNTVQGIRLSTRPDCISEEGLHLLGKYGVKTIELGAQSMDNGVLKESARGHTAEDVETASRMIVAHGFRLGLQMMVGLPGDSFDKSIMTAEKIIGLGACETRIYPVLVIRGTKLEEWYEQGKYKPLSLEEAVFWLKAILPLFEEADLEVTRVGLHASEGLLPGKELVAGPFHTSIRELAMTEIWGDRLAGLFPKNIGENLVVTVHPSQYNFAIGYYGNNRKMLLKHFRNVIFRKDATLKENEFHADYH